MTRVENRQFLHICENEFISRDGSVPFKTDALKNIWKNQVHNMHGKG